MTLIKIDQIQPGQKIQIGDLHILWAIVGPVSPIIQTPQRNYLYHSYRYEEFSGEKVQTWTYKEGPVRKIVSVTGDAQKLWIDWR